MKSTIIVFVLMVLVLGRWREREAAALHLSLTDMLTTTHNRRSILAMLEKEVARTRRYRYRAKQLGRNRVELGIVASANNAVSAF